MSALALVTREWGAQVGGSDRARSSYVERLEAAGISVAIGHDAANVPDDAEVIVSSAIAADNPELTRARVRKRGELLAELVSLRPALVVAGGARGGESAAGAHGKTTTSGMIAFVLDRLGLDPAFLIGGDIAQLGGNARAGEGWLVAEGDESDRSLELLRPQVAVVLNVDLDHHATYGSEAEVRELFERWLEQAPHVVRGDELAPLELELGVPGEHNRRNAAAALAALRFAEVGRAEAEGVRRWRRGRSRGWSGRMRRACCRSSRARAAASRHPVRPAACASSTTTAIIRARSLLPWPPRGDGGAPAACSSFSSHTSTRARVTSRTSWRGRSQQRTPSL